MNKAFPIDYLRQILEQTMFEEHQKNKNYVGGPNQVSLFSFYEQLQRQEEVNRYVERYRDLSDQQNRSGIIANGVIVAPENPTITNLYQALIVPMTYTCSFRCMLRDRDIVLETINHLIEELKGTKIDIAELDTGKLIKVGTIANGGETPTIEEGDFLKKITTNDMDQELNSFISDLVDNGIECELVNGNCYYIETREGKLAVVEYNNGSFSFIHKSDKIVIPSEHTSFKKYKVSLSFDSIRCDEPNTLNADEYCMISFGGSATLVNADVLLGNDLVKVGVKREKLVGEQTITFEDELEWLEPLELPSSSGADTQLNNLLSNKFIANTHTDSLTLAHQYSFILDLNKNLIKQWFMYARYGKQDYITPNITYKVREIISYWGNVIVIDNLTKIVESIDIENTESDTMSITIPLQIQGENN